MTSSCLSSILRDNSKAGQHEKAVINGAMDIGIIQSNPDTILLLRPLHHIHNARIMVRRYRVASQMTVARLTMDRPSSLGSDEGLGSDGIGHVLKGVKAVDVVVKVRDVGS